MADIQYDVLANLTMKGGAFAADMGKAAASADNLGASWGKLVSGGSALLGTLGSVVATAAKIGGVGATVIAGATGAGIASIGGAMAELEGKGIQLASVLAAATKTPFDVMQKQTKSLFDEFRKDAVESAGETADFVDIASKIAGPVMGAGKSMADLHRITKGVVEMAPSLGIDFKQAGSDVMRMLQGTAGMESPLFAAMVAIPSLGIKKAEEFNKLAPEKRIAKLEEALQNPAFRDAAQAYGNSWHGLTSTFSDVTKSAGMMVGEPLFALAKRGLSAFNTAAMAAVQGQAGLKLKNLGTALASDFMTLGGVLKRIFPSFEDSATGAIGVIESLSRGVMGGLITGSRWVADHWSGIKSGAEAAAHWIGVAADRVVAMVSALGGGDMEKGLKRAGEIALAAKVAQVGAPLATMASGAAGLASGGLKMLGGAGAAGGATAAAEGGGAAAAATVGLGTALSWLAIVAIPVGAAVIAFKDNLFGLGARLGATWDRIAVSSGKLWDSLSQLWTAMGRLVEAAMPLISLLGTQLLVIVGVVSGAVEVLVDALGYLVSGLTLTTNSVMDYFEKNKSLAEKYFGIDKLGPTVDDADREKMELPIGSSAPVFSAGAVGNAARQMGAKKPPDKAATKVVVELKWELGDGNEDAIYVRTRKDILKMLADTKGIARTSRLPGT